MKKHTRTVSHRLLGVICLSFLVAFSSGAQESTPEPVPPTEAATESLTSTQALETSTPPLATDVPSATPTDAPTDVPTDSSAEITPISEPTTSAPESTPELITLPPSTPEQPLLPPLTADIAGAPFLLSEDFEDGQAQGWTLSPAWSIANVEGSQALLASELAAARPASVLWDDVLLSLRAYLPPNANLSISLNGYLVTVYGTGYASLSSNGMMIAQGTLPSAETSSVPAWHSLSLRVYNNNVAFLLNNVLQFDVATGLLLTDHSLDLSVSAQVALDDVSITPLMVEAPPTSAPATLTPEIIIIEPSDTAPEATDIAPEATDIAPEATDIAPEATDIAPEATDIAPEATDIAPEATDIAPPTLADVIASKGNMLDVALGQVALTYAEQGASAALSMAQSLHLATDSDGLLRVLVWANFDATHDSLFPALEAVGAYPESVDSPRSLIAYVPISGLADLIQSPAVLALVRPSMSSSTGVLSAPLAQAGTVGIESLDVIGARTWHNDSIRGTGVNIGVVDIGFSGISTGGEYACVRSNQVAFLASSNNAGTSNHGLNILQILCDVAPDSNVYAFRAETPAELASALDAARTGVSLHNRVMDIVLITLDLGAHTSPGDGTNGGNNANQVYAALEALRDNGTLVIASAGNNNGRYMSYTSGPGTSSFSFSAQAGTTLNISWDGWSDASAISTTVSGCALSASPSTSQSSRGGSGAPAYQFVLSGSSTPTTCTVSISNANGKTVQVQVAGTGANLANVSLSGTLLTEAGNLARPADSPDVLAVGAVCGEWRNFNPLQTSSLGPIFGAEGTAPAVLTNPTRAQTKPDLVSVGGVSLSGSLISDAADCSDGIVDGGFSGTSAAAAHMAGMAALLRSNAAGNASMSAFVGTTGDDNLANYLQSHVIDLYDGTPDGFDRQYGAGFSVLGNPSYDISQTVNLSDISYNAVYDNVDDAELDDPIRCSSGNTVYVGLANLNTSADGSADNPYLSLDEAVQNASNGDCIVLMPGEYTTPVTITKAVKVLSYKEAGVALTNGSSFWVVNGLQVSGISGGRPGIVFQNINDAEIFAFAGFNVDNADVSPPNLPSRFIPYVINERRPMALMGAFNGFVTGNNFSNFQYPLLVDGNEENVSNTNLVTLNQNRFTGFAGINHYISLPEAIALQILRMDNIRVSYNRFENNSTESFDPNDNTDALQAVVGINYSKAIVNGNAFYNNQAEAIISINQWEARWDNDPNNSDDDDGFTQWTAAGATLGAQSSYSRSDEIRILNNVIANNNNLKAVVHLVYGPALRFINNTLAEMELIGNTFGAVISVGYVDTANNYDYVFELPNHQFDISNNLFYAVSAQNGILIDAPDTSGRQDLALCRDLLDNLSEGAQNNWFIGVWNWLGSDLCRVSVVDNGLPTNGNIYTSSLISEANLFFTASRDAEHPYRLLPPSTFNLSIITNSDSAMDSGLTPSAGIQTDMQASDARGSDRLVDLPSIGIGATEIDIGAYELNPPDPLTLANQNATVAGVEDQTVISFNVFDLLGIEGGVPPYSLINLVPPTNFSTAANSPCGVAGYTYNANTGILSYCPPRDFYTVGAPSNSSAVFSFDVTSTSIALFGADVAPATVTFNITPSDDGAPTQYGNLSTPYRATADFSSGIDLAILPQVRFNNFALGAPSLLTGQTSKDYPFNFSYNVGSCEFRSSETAAVFEACNDASAPYTQTQLTNAVSSIISNGGRFILDSLPAATGTLRFTYTLSDADSQSSVNTIELTVVQRVLNIGKYDDFDLGMTYENLANTDENPATPAIQPQWLASFLPTAYNFTNHFTRQVGDYVEFTFLGDGFAIALNVGTASANYELQLDPDLTNGVNPVPLYVSGTLNSSLTGISCSKTPIGGTGADRDYIRGQATTTRVDFVVCGGFDNVNSRLGVPRAVRLIHRGTSTQSLALDYIAVRNATLSTGYYEESEIAGYSATGWDSLIQTASGGNKFVQRATSSSATLNFTVDSSVRQVVVYTPWAGTYRVPRVCVDGVCRTGLDLSIYTTSAIWTIPLAVDISSPGTRAISISFPGASLTTPGFLEAVELIGAPSTYIGTGTVQANDARLLYTGATINATGTQYRGGSARQITKPGGQLRFGINGTVSRIIIYHTLGNRFANFDVAVNGQVLNPVACAKPTTTSPNRPSATACEIFGATQYSQALNLTLPSGSGNRIITLTAKGTQTPLIEQIDLLTASGVLGAGLYEDDYPDFIYTTTSWNGTGTPPTGRWTTTTNSASGGNRTYRQTDGLSDELRFTVSADVRQVVVRHALGTVFVPPVISVNGVPVNGTLFQPGNLLQAQVPVFTLTGTIFNNQTSVFLTGSGSKQISVRFPGAQSINIRIGGIEAIELLGAPISYLGLGAIEDNNPALTYSGLWTTSTNTAFAVAGRNNTARNTQRYGSLVSFGVNDDVKRVSVIYTGGTNLAGFDVCSTSAVSPASPTCSYIVRGEGATTYGRQFTFDLSGSGNRIVNITARGVRNGTGNTNVTVNPNFTLEQIVLSGARAVIPANSIVEEDDARLSFVANPDALSGGDNKIATNEWTIITNTASLGNQRIAQNLNDSARVRFTIGADVRQIALIHPINTTIRPLQVCFFTPSENCQTALVAPNGTTSAVLLVNVPNPQQQEVEIRPDDTFVRTLTQFEAIRTYGVGTSISAGNSLEDTDARLNFIGVWSTVTNTAMGGNNTARNSNRAGSAITFSVAADVSRLVLYTTTGSGFGNFEVLEGTTQRHFQATSSASVRYATPIVVNLAGAGVRTITIRSLGTQALQFERLDLTVDANSVFLGPGFYEEDSPNFTLTPPELPTTNPDRWQRVSDSASGRNNFVMRATDVTPFTTAPTLSFRVDTDTVSHILIHHPISTSTRQLRVSIDGGAPVFCPPTLTASGGNVYSATNNVCAIPVTGTGTPEVEISGCLSGVDGCESYTASARTQTSIEAIQLLPKAIDFLSAGSYEENDARLQYSGLPTTHPTLSGSWNTVTNTNFGGNNTARMANRYGALVNIGVNSTVERVIFYVTSGTGFGNLEILVNGSAPTAITTVPSPAGNNTPIVVTLGGSGNRVVTLRSKGSQQLQLESLELLTGASPLSAGFYEEVHPDLSYTGSAWLRVRDTASSRNFYIMRSTDAGASVNFSINATTVGQVLVHYPFSTTYRRLRVTVNGTPTDCLASVTAVAPAVYSTYSNVCAVNVIGTGTQSVSITGIAEGTRTLTAIEAVQLLPKTPPAFLGVGVYEENGIELQYSGIPDTQTNLSGLWNSVTNATMGGNNIARMTNRYGAFVRFGVDASIGRVVVYATGGTGFGNFEVLQDGVVIGDRGNNLTPASFNLPQVFTLTGSGNRTITVRSRGAQQLQIERIELLAPLASASLGVGFYEENHPDFIYTPLFVTTIQPDGWQRVSDGASGRNNFIMRAADATPLELNPLNTPTLEFNVNANTVGMLLVHYPFNASTRQLQVTVGGGSPVLCPANIPAIAPAVYSSYNNVCAIPVNATGTQPVSIRGLLATGRTQTSIEAIQLLPKTLTPLGLGSYEENDAGLVYSGLPDTQTTLSGLWNTVTNNSMTGNKTARMTNRHGAQVRFAIADDVERLALYATRGTGFGNFEIQVDGNPVERFASNLSPSGFNTPIFYVLPAGTGRTVTIRSLGSQQLQIERLDLLTLSSVGALTPGFYEEDNEALVYTPNSSQPSGWLRVSDSASNRNRFIMRATDVSPFNTTASVRFEVDATIVKRLLIHYPAGSVYRQLQVTVNSITTNCPLSPISGTLYSNVCGVNVTGVGTQMVTISGITGVAGRTQTAIEAIQLLGELDYLNVGFYEEDDNRLQYSGLPDTETTLTGLWNRISNTAMLGNKTARLANRFGAEMRFGVNNNVGRAVLYLSTGSGFGNFEVRIEQANGTEIQTWVFPANVSSSRLTTPVVIDVTGSGARHVIVRSLGTQQVQIEAIDLLAARQNAALGAGLLEETDLGLAYYPPAFARGASSNTTWYFNNVADGRNGRIAQTGNLANISNVEHEVRFTIANTVEALAVYYSSATTFRQWQVCFAEAPYTSAGNCSDLPTQPSPLTAGLANNVGYVDVPNGLSYPLEVRIIPKASPVSPVRTQVAFEAIELFSQPAELLTGQYLASNPQIQRVGLWAVQNNTAYISGTSSVASRVGARLRFAVDGAGDFLNLYYARSTSAGNFDILVNGNKVACSALTFTPALVGASCSDAPSAPTVPTTSATVNQALVTLNTGTLSDGDVVEIVARGTQSVIIQQVEWFADGAPLVEGLYNDSNSNISYEPGYTQITQSGATGGTVRRSQTSNSRFEFDMTGTGFILYVQRQTAATAPTIEIRWGASANDTQTVLLSAPTTQLPVGIPILGLPPSTYTVEVTCVDCSSTRSFVFDHVLVLNRRFSTVAPADQLTPSASTSGLAAGNYDDRDSRLAYLPAVGLSTPAWTQASVTGFLSGTLTSTRIHSAPLIFATTGRNLTIKAQINTANADSVEVCIIRTPDNALRRVIECSTYSQRGTSAAGTPIELRNLGTGNKLVVVMNRAFGQTLTIDQIEVRN